MKKKASSTITYSHKKKFLTVLLCWFLAFSISITMTHFITTCAGQQTLSLKWKTYLGSKARTQIGPLAADLNADGKLEIIITGGPIINGTWSNDGSVTVLDGSSGKILWQTTSSKIPKIGIDPRTPFDVIDLNKDGLLEIVIYSHNGPLVLRGSDGSLFWRRMDVPGDANFGAVCDIDADGYVEVFIDSGDGPYRGYDYITSLTYDGRIISQTICWHPCWGGLSIGDPAFNGTFILYEGDRSINFNPDTDPYKYGGWGVRALDARTLTPLWNDSDILCSSHVPMLADVDRDGMLDIVVAHQGGGFAVYNALNGQVLTTGGKYRKSLNLNIRSHSQPTVYDIDEDGNLEIITCRKSYVYIWDLYDWKLDDVLQINCYEPPKLGDVTGDGKMDIIAVTQDGKNIHIFSYVKINNTYSNVFSISGLSGASAFTLVQDVDGDGLNELIVSSLSANLYCYDTIAQAPSHRARSNLQFYSEYKRGVSEYVLPPGPQAPIISEPTPSDGAKNIPITLSKLSFKLTDFQYDPISYTVATSPDIGQASDINVSNGKVSVPISGLTYATTYTWTVTATDGINTNTKTFKFTTSDSPPWYRVEWLYRRTLIINQTKVNGDQTNFPVVIDLTDSSLKTKAQPDGDDFVFTDQNNNKLDHQIEYYDNTTGRLIAWVKVPYLSSTADTVLYLYYGNPTCENQQNQAAVWDASYSLVLHFNEKSGTHYDSTANNNDGAPRNGVSQGVSCKIDGGDTFDGTNDYIEISHSNTLSGYTNALTISFWVKLDDTSIRQTILGKYNTATNQRSWFVDYNPRDRPKAPIGFYASPDGTTYKEWWASFIPSAGTWHHVIIVWEANKVPKFYINGARVSTVGTATISQIYNNVGVPLYIGRCQYDKTRYFKGSIDEIQIINKGGSADWIITAYNNQQNPTTFHSIGPEETLQ
jgi:hypothetical protein